MRPGAGAGEGSTLNIPRPARLPVIDVYAAALEQIIEPAVRRYAPDFVLVSLGFDAFWADPLASLRLSIAGAYTPLLRSARDLAAELCAGAWSWRWKAATTWTRWLTARMPCAALLLGEEPLADPLGPRARSSCQLSLVEPQLSAIRRLHHLG